jgi:hypothetical protein
VAGEYNVPQETAPQTMPKPSITRVPQQNHNHNHQSTTRHQDHWHGYHNSLTPRSVSTHVGTYLNQGTSGSEQVMRVREGKNNKNKRIRTMRHVMPIDALTLLHRVRYFVVISGIFFSSPLSCHRTASPQSMDRSMCVVRHWGTQRWRLAWDTGRRGV